MRPSDAALASAAALAAAAATPAAPPASAALVAGPQKCRPISSSEHALHTGAATQMLDMLMA